MIDNECIIRSIIDNDLYKFTQQQAVIQLFPRHYVKYKFINRGNTKFPDGFDVLLRQELKKMEHLSLLQNEALFLTLNCEFLTPTYIDFLRGYRYDSTEVGVTQHDGDLDITISGYWYKTILWEVPLMALISELYFKMTGEDIDDRSIREKNNHNKGKKFYQYSMKVADFGTRRRYSYDNQFEVVKDLQSVFDNGNPFLIGTSNIHIAMKLGLKPIGTHAHEWVSAIAALMGYNYANKNMMDAWISVYQGDLGIALTDTFGLKSFLNDFDKKFAKLFDGVRHDSGDPFDFSNKIVAHYKSLGIDPMSKTIVFSDGLDVEKSIELHNYCKNKIKTSFGIGTNLTNSIGVKPINMVIKIVSINGKDAIKLSDIKDKHTGNKETIDIVKKMINY